MARGGRKPRSRRSPAGSQRAAAGAERPRRTPGGSSSNLPKLKKYRDYREMLEKQKDIDAVVIATPDHMHAPIATPAMGLGKHVYVQKPLCWSVQEARDLAKKAKENPKVVTQMGNQGTPDDARTGYELITAARSAKSARSTSGPTGRSATGRRAFRARRLSRRPGRAAVDGRARRWHCRGSPATIRSRTSSIGTCSSAGPEGSTTTRSTTRSTGAAGWTGARGPRRHGRAPRRSPVLGLKLGYPTTIETMSTPFNGAVSDRHDDILRVPGAGSCRRSSSRGSTADCCLPSPRRSATRAAERRRPDLRRQQGQADAGHLRLEPRLLTLAATRQSAAEKLKRIATKSTR